MKYTSTRSDDISCSFEDAICSGYAPDGGLFVPQSLPRLLTPSLLMEWSTWSYPKISQAFLRFFISIEEVSDECLEQICTNAFDGFEDPIHVVPVRKLAQGTTKPKTTTFLAELYHGPTFCFKDLGMRVVVQLLGHFCTQRQRRMTLLVSTTGDTGPAAVRAVSDLHHPLLSILVHYPQGQISEFQRKQMTTVVSPHHVKVVAFQGGGDDMDIPIKRILTTQTTTLTTTTTTRTTTEKSNHSVCGVNSYNIGRPLMQAVHFIWTYLRVMEQLGMPPGDQIDIVVPTGAMGNIAGGYMAKKMGLPIRMLCAAVNVNDITHRTFQEGAFFKSPHMIKTLSEAINIQVPYNFERLLFYLTDGNHTLVREWMTTMDQSNKLQLDRNWLERLQTEFRSARVTDDEMCQTIRNVFRSYNYIADPHTAVAICGAIQLGYLALNSDNDMESSIDDAVSKDVKCSKAEAVAILATASPCKFQEAVSAALGDEGWEFFMEHDFPSHAREILSKPEVDPVVFEAANEHSLDDVQNEWEQRARQLLKEFGE